MAIKDIIAKGIGFSPGSTIYIPTHGFSIGAVPVIPPSYAAGGYAGASEAHYEIWYGNDAGVRQALISQVGEFEYLKVLNDVGFFSLMVPLSFNRSLIRRDARIEIWRAFPGGPLTLDLLGFLRRYRYKTDSQGVTRIALEGPDQNYTLKRRDILYYAGSSQAIATAEYADNLQKRLVRENLGASATDTARNLASLGLTVAADLSAAQQVTMAFHYKNLLDVCQEAAEASQQKGTQLYFGIVPLSPTALEFQTKINQWGFDRTTVGNQGILGIEFGNLAEPELEVDWFDEITHVTALGRAEGAAQVTRTAEDTARSGASLWNRNEGIVNAGSELTGNGVQDKAKAELERQRPHRRFSGRIVQTRGFIYGRDWGLGDKLGWTYLNEQGTGPVRSVSVRVDGKRKETIDARLETE